mmetsp:Transcript_59312/g.134291  ORF Transcript_59312/g.134291 Transcript_59312/m.134291 type:complete len:95 (+) Transcript_59312:58-342(+)
MKKSKNYFDCPFVTGGDNQVSCRRSQITFFGPSTRLEALGTFVAQLAHMLRASAFRHARNQKMKLWSFLGFLSCLLDFDSDAAAVLLKQNRGAA